MVFEAYQVTVYTYSPCIYLNTSESFFFFFALQTQLNEEQNMSSGSAQNHF
jgi:hypothetical protein